MTADQLRTQVAKTVSRRGFLPALLTATGVFAAVLVHGFLLATISSLSVAGFDDGGPGSFAGGIWVDQLQLSLTGSLPFAIGVFLSLWQIAPIGPELRLAHVITRALLAAVLGAAAVVVIVVLLSLIGALAELPGLLFGSGSGGSFAGFGTSVYYGVVNSAQSFVQYLPIVALAAVLLWGWLDRHPLRHDVAGTVDEL